MIQPVAFKICSERRADDHKRLLRFAGLPANRHAIVIDISAIDE